ncbi:hypothetical protein C9374_002902 [Naegleria lovaniensis]|uniref:Uncharacterized protein n=1 Tax=Naegleria lovaniensis TaxID=51637 RepID=A0AA88GTI8_NAELO|nr:uncharacterized protein C9374_002902 [Naegleria lovaniensis]KAG2385753.1 hypothetical protein C9374_002902 [Naegleria lovaniensis]
MLKIDACQRKDWTNILNELKSIMLMLLYSLHDVTTLVFSDRTKTVLMEDISLIFRYQYPWKKHKLNSPLIDTNDPTVFDQALIHSKSEKKEREYILSKRQHSPSIGNEMEFSPNSPTQISIQYENRYRMYSVEKLKDGSKKFLDSIFQSRYTNILCTHKWPQSFFKPFILSKYMENITTLLMDGNYEVLDGMGSIRLKNVTELDVTNMEPCTIEIIAGVFSNLRSLILNENRMGPLSAKLISESFKHLTKLDLSGNAIGDEGAHHLANSVHLQHLVKLYLINNDIGAQGAICIATSPNLTQLQVLNLCRNSIGPKGIGALASSNNMKNLTELGLSYCSIGHEGAMYICSSISFTNLTSLYLIGNSLTETDISLILQKLKKLKQASLFAKPSLDRK